LWIDPASLSVLDYYCVSHSFLLFCLSLFLG
jgi:hypothetical protein